MAKFHLTKKAVEDLTEIWNYTYEEWSEKQADSYYSLLLDTCQAIADNPLRGKKYDIGFENLLGYKSSQHIVFYQMISKTEIKIIRILHVSMDLKNTFE